MKLGICMFPTEYSMTPAALGRAVEERGFESLFFPEHTHIPKSRQSPWPGGPSMPREYAEVMNPVVALGAVAAVTERIRLGTGVSLVVEHDPIVLAKEIATLDRLSGGRVIFGVGAGWNREEMQDHGTDPRTRFALLRERVQAMKTIWTQDEPEYHGTYVNFEKMWQWPKPVQKPHPPVLLGGNGPGAIGRVVAYADGWMPMPGRAIGPLDESIAELRRRAEQAGRGPLPVTFYGAAPDQRQLERYERWGVERCIFIVPPAKEDRVLPVLDECARLVERFPES